VATPNREAVARGCNMKIKSVDVAAMPCKKSKFGDCKNQLTSPVPIGTFYTWSLAANYTGCLILL